MGLSWDAVENALHDWVVSASGGVLGASAVVWEGQNNPRPAMPFASISHDGGDTLGASDEQRTGQNPSPSPGNEILITTLALTEFLCTVEVFTADVKGDTWAVPLLAKIRNGLQTSAQTAAFNAAGVAVVDTTPIQRIPDLLNTKFAGRARLQVRFRVADFVTETTGYIATANVTETLS